jgi:hypothetical protein
MGDDVREYLRAAQAAELQGNKPQAVELLRKAAALYRNQGNTSRALQMLRHAHRIDGKNAEVEQELGRMEWLPVLDEPARPRELIERGPTLADPALQAWCSFCCRPRTEVGELVAGPAGAFICAACVRESFRLLGDGPPAVEPAVAADPAFALVGQRALEAGLRTILDELRALVARLPPGSSSARPTPAVASKGRQRRKKASR